MIYLPQKPQHYDTNIIHSPLRRHRGTKGKEMTQKLTVQIAAAYLGCKCIYPDTEGIKKVKARLTAVSLDGIETTYLRRRRSIHGGWIAGDMLSWKSNVSHNSNALNTQLILSPLDDLTDAHALTLSELFGHANPSDELGKELVKYFVWNSCLTFHEAVRMTNQLRVWGYDCDELISAGIAVDAKTVGI